MNETRRGVKLTIASIARLKIIQDGRDAALLRLFSTQSPVPKNNCPYALKIKLALSAALRCFVEFIATTITITAQAQLHPMHQLVALLITVSLLFEDQNLTPLGFHISLRQ